MAKGLDPITRVASSSGVGGMYIDVTSPTYGAVGDGVADDTTAIQSAIDAASALTGAMVYLPPGTYRHTGLTFYGTAYNGIGLFGRNFGRYVVNTTLIYDGVDQGKAIDVINASGCYFARFAIDVGATGNQAIRGINIDQDATHIESGCSITSGSNILTGTQFFRANMIGKAITVSGAGVAGADLVTTVSGFTDFAHITLTANASTTKTANATVTIVSPYPAGSTTGTVIEGMDFRNYDSNPDLIMVSVAYYSWQNCELMKILNCKFYQNYQFNTPTNASRGIAISLGNATGGGGANNFNQIVHECEFTGYSYDVNCATAIASIRDCEFQFATVNIIGDGQLEIIHNRPENSRQILKLSNGYYDIRFNSIGISGAWDAAYPTMEFSGGAGRVAVEYNEWNDDPGNTISAIKYTGSGGITLVSKGNHYPNTQHILGGQTFNTFRFWSSELDEPSPRVQLGSSGNGAPPLIIGTVPFTYLSFVPAENGATIYVTDGLPGSNPAAGGGSGAFAEYVNGTWVCRRVPTTSTGWGAPTGTATRATFATSTVTLPDLAERLKGLIDDLTTQGLLGP